MSIAGNDVNELHRYQATGMFTTDVVLIIGKEVNKPHPLQVMDILVTSFVTSALSTVNVVISESLNIEPM